MATAQQPTPIRPIDEGPHTVTPPARPTPVRTALQNPYQRGTIDGGRPASAWGPGVVAAAVVLGTAGLAGVAHADPDDVGGFDFLDDPDPRFGFTSGPGFESTFADAGGSNPFTDPNAAGDFGISGPTFDLGPFGPDGVDVTDAGTPDLLVEAPGPVAPSTTEVTDIGPTDIEGPDGSAPVQHTVPGEPSSITAVPGNDFTSQVVENLPDTGESGRGDPGIGQEGPEEPGGQRPTDEPATIPPTAETAPTPAAPDAGGDPADAIRFAEDTIDETVDDVQWAAGLIGGADDLDPGATPVAAASPTVVSGDPPQGADVLTVGAGGEPDPRSESGGGDGRDGPPPPAATVVPVDPGEAGEPSPDEPRQDVLSDTVVPDTLGPGEDVGPTPP
ncbi:MAG: hypothetical protein H7Y15_04070, partial [Pseudonocardia sp.]|nr:hypothetical protein [Pseudonocardia sp.]